MSAKVHFSGLDGLRFISITFVVLHHLFTFKANYGFAGIDLPVLGDIGYYGIQFFFAGSGFLITYLLLHEKSRYGKISLKSFYIRRILRIWPAYYLLIFLALVVTLNIPFFNIPQLTDVYINANAQKGNLFYFLFLPHIVPFSFPTAPYVHQTYTIGIEEQFYFIWGMLFFFIPKITKRFFTGILVSIVAINFTHDFFYTSLQQMEHIKAVDVFLKFATYLKYCRISTFAIGSLFAFAYFEKKEWVQIFKSPFLQLFIYCLLIGSIWFDWYIPYCRDEYIAIVMLCIFGIATFKQNSIINYSAAWLSFLGKVSYGIYLFHIFAIVIAIKICSNIFHFEAGNYFHLSMLIVLTILLSILFGIISYYTIEKFFLHIKKRFEKV